MSDASTIKLIEYYEPRLARPRFFSGKFRSPRENFHATEYVEIDVRRNGRRLAIPVRDLRSGPRHMSRDKTVNKRVKPSVYKYETNVAAGDLMERAPGVDPFTDPNFMANATREAYGAVGELEGMFRDAIELMGSQVFQTGTLTLNDASGNSVFALDFLPKDDTGTLASGDHIVTVDTEWAADGSTGEPLDDIEALSDNVAASGYDVTDVCFGAGCLNRFLANAKVQTHLNLMRASFGVLNPAGQPAGGGASPVGSMIIGSRLLRLWSYNATYIHPQTGANTRFLATNKFVMWDETAPRDLTWGAIPKFPMATDARAASFLPSRLSFSDNPERDGGAIDMALGAYFTPDGENLVVTVGSRPLTIPTAIDSIACATCYTP